MNPLPVTVWCLHRWFLNSWRSNEQELSERLARWVVRCHHCGHLIAGNGPSAEATEVVWRHDGSTWFGTFTEIT